MELQCDAVVIGAGVAGLAAAADLTRARARVVLLEAQNRMGGRILTVHDPDSEVPIELGAEFVHGKPPEIWDLARTRNLALREITGRDWCAQGRGFGPCTAFEKVDAVLSRMTRSQPDRSFLEFIEQCCADDEEAEARKWAVSYVRGFHAARVEEVSVNSLVEDTDADEEIGGDQPFRIVTGYDQVINALSSACSQEYLNLSLNTRAERIKWARGAVTVTARAESGEALEVSAAAGVITVPLAVLQAGVGSKGVLAFDPPLEEKRAALALLAMGKVIRVTLRFRERFWESRERPRLSHLRFLLSEDKLFPTWWCSEPSAPVLTGWAPAECAEALAGRTADDIVHSAVESLGRILCTPAAELQQRLARGYVHDWQSDPYARGAYSYVKVGGEHAARELARPLADTLFFAGEATHFQGQHGTVHGAIATGRRAAQEVLSASPIAREHLRKLG